jgi:flavin-dependent dehydrogenase
MIDKTAIIVGGGPAGAACAWRLKRAGVDALVLDKDAFPRQKLCAGWITPQVFRLLRAAPDEYPESLVVLNRLICHFRGRRIPIRTRQYSIRRCEFDAWLLRRSGAAVDLHKVEKIRSENGRFLIDDRYRARYLVGAGGTHCPVYRQIFSPVFPRSEDRRIDAVEIELEWRERDPNCYLWFFEGRLPGYAWHVPKGGGYLNIGIGGKHTAMKRRGMPINRHWRKFREKLAESGLVPGRPFHAGGHVYYIRHPRPLLQRGRAYITGDAAGLATVDMGEGIAPAIESGLQAAEAIIDGKPYRMPALSRYSVPGILHSGIRQSLKTGRRSA